MPGLEFESKTNAHSLYECQAGLHSPLGVFFGSAGDITLNLSLVYTVHGQPNHCASNRQAPEGVSQPWIKTEANGNIKQQLNTVGRPGSITETHTDLLMIFEKVVFILFCFTR